MRILCWFGLHDWFLNGVRSDRFIYMCSRCPKHKDVYKFAEVPDRWL